MRQSWFAAMDVMGFRYGGSGRLRSAADSGKGTQPCGQRSVDGGMTILVTVLLLGAAYLGGLLALAAACWRQPKVLPVEDERFQDGRSMRLTDDPAL